MTMRLRIRAIAGVCFAMVLFAIILAEAVYNTQNALDSLEDLLFDSCILQSSEVTADAAGTDALRRGDSQSTPQSSLEGADPQMRTGVLKLPSSLQVIEESAFEGTNSLVVALPEGVRVVQQHAFANAVQLRHINLPSTVENLGEDIFEGDWSVTIHGRPDSKAQDYARRYRIRFRSLDVILVPIQDDMLHKKQMFVFFMLAQLLAITLCALYTGRRDGEVRLIRRRIRFGLYPLDWCFP